MIVQMSSIIVAIASRKFSRGNKKRQRKFKRLFFFGTMILSMAMILVGRNGLTMTHLKSISRHTNPDDPSSPSENGFLEPVNTMH